MKRREFIGLLSSAALSFPRPGSAQTKTDLPVIGFLLPPKLDTTVAKDRITSFRNGLQEEGYIEGTNYSLAVRSTGGDFNSVPQIARELGALAPRVFVVAGSGVDQIRQSFPEIPLVFTAIAADPLALGWVQSYVHPSGMLTGNVMNAVGGEESMTQKRIGFFKQLVPDLTRLGMVATAAGVAALKEKDALQKVATKLGFELFHYGLKKSTIWKAHLRRAFATMLARSTSRVSL